MAQKLQVIYILFWGIFSGEHPESSQIMLETYMLQLI